jgi:hypothetical protein
MLSSNSGYGFFGWFYNGIEKHYKNGCRSCYLQMIEWAFASVCGPKDDG